MNCAAALNRAGSRDRQQVHCNRTANLDRNMNNSLSWLQFGRGFAAFLVFAFHLTPHVTEIFPGLSFLRGIFHWGFAGVDIFFVLSGFVIAMSNDQRGGSRRDFIVRRIVRIYSGYWPVLLLYVACYIFLLQRPLPINLAFRSIFLTSPWLEKNWIPTAWSLTHELYFYLWFAAIFGLSARSKIRFSLTAMLVVSAWNLWWFLVRPEAVWGGVQPLFFLLTGALVEFFMGIVLFYLYAYRRTYADTWLWVGVSVILISMGLHIGTGDPLFDRIPIARALTFGLAGVGVLGILLAMEKAGMRLPGCAVKSGDSSYSMYLLHPLMIDIGMSIIRKHLAYGAAFHAVVILSIVVVTYVASYFWFICLERPLYNHLSRTREKSLVKVAAHEVVLMESAQQNTASVRHSGSALADQTDTPARE